MLYSGKIATSKSFVLEYHKLFGWLEKNIPNYKKNKYLSIFSPKGEPFKYRLIINVFVFISNIKLIGVFSKIYCKGR